MTAGRKKVMFSLSEALEYYLDYMDLKIAKKRAESKEEVLSLSQIKAILK